MATIETAAETAVHGYATQEELNIARVPAPDYRQGYPFMTPGEIEMYRGNSPLTLRRLVRAWLRTLFRKKPNILALLDRLIHDSSDV